MRQARRVSAGPQVELSGKLTPVITSQMHFGTKFVTRLDAPHAGGYQAQVNETEYVAIRLVFPNGRNIRS